MAPFDIPVPAAQRDGPVHRPTVVLLHSSASSSRQWTALIEQLQPRFDVRAVDFHDHGAGPLWQGGRPLTLADEAELVEPLLREPGGVHLVGHSYGGAVALKVAELHPGLVRSLVVYEPVMFRWLLDSDGDSPVVHEIIAVAEAMREYLAQGNELGAAARFVNYWSGPVWSRMPLARQQAIASRMPTVLLHFYAAFGEVFPLLRAALRTMPMLCLAGADTVGTTRRISQLLEAELPGATHRVLPGLGHMGPMTHPALVNPVVVKFLHAVAPNSAVEEALAIEA